MAREDDLGHSPEQCIPVRPPTGKPWDRARIIGWPSLHEMSMDSGLKQRLIGAAVLIALAVIFLPMLVKGPAPESGVADLPLALPDAPAARGETVTRDLPLIAPPPAPEDGGVLEARRRGDADAPPPRAAGEFPTVDTGGDDDAAQPASDDDAALPASTAAGDYAVHFGSYGSSVNADTVVNRLSTAGFPASSTQATASGKPVWRVRIGPYATRAEAEAVRVAATEVGPNDARVIALDGGSAADSRTASSPPPAAAPTPARQAQAPQTQAPQQPQQPTPQAAQQQTPSAQPPAPTSTAPAAAAGTGFVVQLGAFRSAADADAMRDRVRGLGFSAFTDTVQTEQGQLTRVKAGPVVDRADADRLRSQISSRAGIDGMVRSNP